MKRVYGILNAALESSDAKYKIYMHQDVFIYHKGFIEDILRLFKAHDRLGLMGHDRRCCAST